MIKEKLKEKEPVVYTCLYNDLLSGHLSHSYLLCGSKNPFMKDAAFLLAQSIIENRNDFACEICPDCIRIKEGKHLDVLYIDGDSEIIKREDIDHVLSEFAKTAAEKSGRKVYIIQNINNSSTKVLNMILKFMEEPANENTYGIFISEDVDNLLETVVSRCERLNFVSTDYSDIREEYLKNGFDEMDAYLLSEIRHEYNEEDAAYRIGKDVVYAIGDSLDKPDSLPMIFYGDIFTLKNVREVLDMVIEIMIHVLDDSLSMNSIGDSEYDSLLDKFHNDALALLEIFLDAKAVKQQVPSADIKLIFDRLCCKIMEVKSGKRYE